MKTKIVGLILISFSVQIFAQSGRGRNPAPPPPPKPTTNQPTVAAPTILNLPDGGKIMKHEVDNSTSRFVLKNGLTVIIRERHSVPLAAVTTYIKAGYFNEPDETAGLAHLMEHMFFKGTTSRPMGKIETDTAKLGGQLNASTSYEKTSYYAIAPAESLPKILEIQADMLLNPTFDPEEIKKEALVVIQESKRKQDNATALALEKMYGTAFTTHRMKRWRIGSEAVLQAATREQLQAYYQSFYRPENTVLVIVGDVFTMQIIGQIQQLYANFAAAPKVEIAPENKSDKATASAPVSTVKKTATQPNSKPVTIAKPAPKEPVIAVAPVIPAAPVSPLGIEESAQEKLRYSNERGDIGQSVITFGYHVPALTKTAEGLKEQAALEVMSAVLGLGRGARLHQSLIEKSASASSVNIDFSALPTAGIFSAQLTVAPDRIDKAEAEYFREIEKFRREVLSDGELQRAKSMLEKNFYNATAALNHESEFLAHYQSQLGDFKLLDSAMDRMRAVTAKDIQQVAAKYFSLSNTTVHEYEPRTALARTYTPEKFSDAVAIFAPAALQSIKPEDIKPAVTLKQFAQGRERNLNADADKVSFVPLPLPIKDFSVYRGPRAYVREDKAQPKLTIGVFFQGGRLTEDQTNSGITELMLRSMMKSTMTRKGDLIALEMESYGGEIILVNEPDFFGFTLDVLSRNAEKAVSVLMEIIENPYFDPKDIPREKEAISARQIQQRDNGLQRPVELAMASIYAGHPYGLPRYGLPTALKTVTDETLEAWHKKLIKRQLPLVVLVGDTDGSALVASIFSEGFKRSSTDLDQVLKVSLPPLTETPVEKIEPRNRKQTAQVIAFRMPTTTNPYALQVLQNYASGMGGRLFTELRDKQSLAYTVRLSHQQNLASGALLAYIATSPENEGRAKDGLLKELENLIKTPPSEEEFERGRNAAIGSFAVRLQSSETRLMEYIKAIVAGQKPMDVENQPDLIRAIKPEDIKTAAEAIIKLNQAGRGVVRGEAGKN